MRKINLKYFIFILLIFLCGFNYNDYKVETIINNGIKIKFYIPKNYCQFKYDINNSFIQKLLNEQKTSLHNEYYYRRCSEVLKINSNKKFNDGDVLNITLPKINTSSFFNHRKIAKTLLKNIPQTHLNIINKYQNTFNNIDIDKALNQTEYSKRDKEYLKTSFEEFSKYYSLNNKITYSIIYDNLIINSQFELNNKKYSINDFFGYFKGLFVNINYQGINNHFPLENKKLFAEYIKETELLNTPKINNYFMKNNQIINIKNPNFGNFYDIYDTQSQKLLFLKVLSENSSKNKYSYNLTISNTNIDFNLENLYQNFKKRFPNKTIELKKYKNKEFIKIYLDQGDKKNILYSFPLTLNDLNFVLSSSIVIYNEKDFIKKDEVKIINNSIKYIKYLTKINKNN